MPGEILIDSLRTLCVRNAKCKEKLEKFFDLEESDIVKQDECLQTICECLMDIRCTEDVAICFKHLLPVLLPMSIHTNVKEVVSEREANNLHRLNCVVMGKIISVLGDTLLADTEYIEDYFECNPAPFVRYEMNVKKMPKRQKLDKLPFRLMHVSDFDIVNASYFLCSATLSLRHITDKWDWSIYFSYLRHPELIWVALKCIAIVLRMSESLRLSCARSFMLDIEEFLTDHQRKNVDAPNIGSGKPDVISNIARALNSVVSIGNVILPVLTSSSERERNSNLISVQSMEENLQSLALALTSRRCICLQGPVGCGKTALIEYLAEVTGHDSTNFIKVQLGDQMDSKMLLGMYRCTDIPGEFVWQPGVLTQAVIGGKWLLLEDIDSAALDVASVLSNLIETGTLSVPGYRDAIHARTGFQLFVTQRLISSATGLQRQSSGVLSLLEKHWLCVNVEPLSMSELVTIVQALFPLLKTVATRVVDVYLLFAVGSHGDENNMGVNLKTGRQISTRDLLKWCSRAVIDFDVSSPDSGLKLFQDALDVFCYSVPGENVRLKLAVEVAHKLGIVKTKAEYFCNMYKPTMLLLPNVFVAGRAQLPRKRLQYASLEQAKTNFTFTRPSACLLERITSCIAQNEPVLLVGETGTGKTSSIQYLARCSGHKLVVINMNQQSESADLLGGYKPVDFKCLISPIREEFEILFRSYFAIEPNRKFLRHVVSCYNQEKWKTLVSLMNHCTLAAIQRLKAKVKENELSEHSTHGKRLSSHLSEENGSGDNSAYTNVHNTPELLRRWEKVSEKLKKLELQVKSQYSLAFSFIEGTLVKGLKEGCWVLLDEINLATAETLECLSGLLEGSSESLSLWERGDQESIKRHKDFTIFACMNPATDVGKKDLPVGLRNRFTEFYVDELTEHHDLLLLVESYLKDLNLPLKTQQAIVKFYLHVRKEAMLTLFDGTGHKPHYSLRTLCRALNIAATNPCGNVLRSLYEAFSLSFLTQLDFNSYPIVQKMIARAILDNKMVKAVLGTPIPKPKCGSNENYICFEGYWVIKGNLEPETPKDYILTKSVRRNLTDLVRVVSIGKIPVLLQGDTSVGKTSLIMYLAKASGHTCVRINNHEHTDLQEYVGSYVADETGKLVFKEGVLIQAMRKGYWIILDELNLAPSDVLEALNRVLDDNREIFIPETQQVVKAHDNFMLFATQNPPGLYGGRKVLSRAFRNRFVELHFDEIPADELKVILHERCKMPESYCKQVISVMTDLQVRRKTTAAFAGKQGFITLRDLFRWGERYRLAPDMGNRLYDWSQHLADEGYLVLAAKVRKPEEAEEIRTVLKKHLKRDVDPNNLFTLHDETSPVTRHILEEILNSNNHSFNHIVWTYHMRRMAVLVRKSCQFKEPVLLVGETGGGKTTICHVIAALNNQVMHCVNCHMHTESSDFLGNLRPVREHSDIETQRLFEWVDGPLIHAMRNGDLFLADEISLADDSVLERLNSLLEPERSLLLAEKGIESNNDNSNIIIANEKFIFVGTMNPGGDYGKKELSPALRNRFTEIWCEGCISNVDLCAIIEHNIRSDLQPMKASIAKAILNFVEWLPTTEVGRKFTVSIRDVLTWANFINICTSENTIARLSVGDAYYHGACLTYIDSLGSGSTGSEHFSKLADFRTAAIKFVKSQLRNVLKSELRTENVTDDESECLDGSKEIFGITPFYIKRGPDNTRKDDTFTFSTITTKLNALKLLRGLQTNKPILLEGSPGVGKTSLVSALAKASGYTILRINLSDQTDVSDLFGADLPVEGGKSGEFAWKDGPFLRALRAGHWILLDELNLASQSVLEGLNACFDHRGEVYIPELGKTFSVKPGTRLFACQNPLRQGGGRRGLPKSFLNRFTQVFVDALVEDDLQFILGVQFPQLPSELLNSMIKFNMKLASEAGHVWGHAGSPWEMNLRDVTRWCEATIKSASNEFHRNIDYNPGNAMELIYTNRMRTKEDRQRIYNIYEDMFTREKYPLPPAQPPAYITLDALYVGDVSLSRTEISEWADFNLLLLRDQKATLRNLMQCVQMNWMSILVGGSGSGKSTVVRLLASLLGQKLRSIAVNSAMDTTEILGGFEQTDYNRHLEQLFERTENLVLVALRRKFNRDTLEEVARHYGLLRDMRCLMLDADGDTSRTMASETKLFLRKTEQLLKLVRATRIFDPSHETELREIETELRNLTDHVEQDKCLNAGGKFEWVDSVLVKCLQDGTWLLIDQVNLCSPAVLDRLNGLLEPNGVLSIGERGVDCEGNVITVKPHKNFRLFLTMDPRYGEISRAMRNRGVELYILGPKEKADYSAIDLRSLLYNVGLVESNHQDALLGIHGTLSQDPVALDKSTVVELLHCAFLAKQRLLRGFAASDAITRASVDVYVKSRCVRDARVKDRLFPVIDRFVREHVDGSGGARSFLDLDAATWSVRNALDNCKLTVVRQHGSLLMAAIGCYAAHVENTAGDRDSTTPTTASLDEFFELRETPCNARGVAPKEIAGVLLHLLVNFYELSSLDDVALRRRWLSKALTARSVHASLRHLADRGADLAEQISVFAPRAANSSLPWDVTQLAVAGPRDEDEQITRDAHKLALLLYMRATGAPDVASAAKDVSARDRGTMSVREYSDAIYHDKVASHLKNQPLVTDFAKLVAQLSGCIEAILRDDSFSIDAKKYVELRRGLKWRGRFCELGEMTLVNKSNDSASAFPNLEEVSLSLRVHYKWLMKFVYKLFAVCEKASIGENCEREIKTLSRTANDINSRLVSVHDPFRKLSKKIAKHVAMPLPHSSERSMRERSLLKETTARFVPARGAGRSMKLLKILAVHFCDDSGKAAELRDLWVGVYEEKASDPELPDRLREIVRYCQCKHLDLRTPTQISTILSNLNQVSSGEVRRATSAIQTWPIYEYMVILHAHALQRETCEALSGTQTTNRTETVAAFPSTPNVPINLTALMHAIAGDTVGLRQKVLHLQEMFVWLARFIEQSYATRDSLQLLQWRGMPEDDIERIVMASEESEIHSFIDGPVLFYLVLRSVFSGSDDVKRETGLSAPTLGTYTAKLNQLRGLNKLLWRNSVALTSKRFSVAYNDAATLQFHLQSYISALDKVEAEVDLRELVEASVRTQSKYKKSDLETSIRTDYLNPAKDLRDLAERLESGNAKENVLEVGKGWTLLGYLRFTLFGNLGYIDPVHKIGLKHKYLEEDIDDFEKLVYVTEMQSCILGTTLRGPYAPRRFVETEKTLRDLLGERDGLERLKAYRPPNSDYVRLANEAANFRNTMACSEVVYKHINGLLDAAGKIGDNCTATQLRSVRDTLQQAEMWKLSVERFFEQTESRYLDNYPDIALPLLLALSQMKHGVGVLIDHVRRLLRACETSAESSSVQSFIENAARFPTVGPGQEDLPSLVNLCTSASTRTLISKTLSADVFASLKEQFRMTKSGLHELFNYIVLNRGITRSLWRDLNGLLQQIILIWKQQQRQAERLAAEKESMYKNRAEIQGSVPTEEEEINTELRNLFPTCREEDFGDIDDASEPSLEQRSTAVESADVSYNGLISEGDIREVQQIHSAIVTTFVVCPWLKGDDRALAANYVEPLVQRYNTVGSILESVSLALTHDLSSKLYNGLNFLVTLTLDVGEESRIYKDFSGCVAKRARAYDFYRDANVERAKECLPLCDGILERANEQLGQFPDHPTLSSIKTIVERIHGFPVTSPVSRFLTGLELLLAKLHQWEENAHSGVSFCEEILSLTRQIVSWRQLELACWKNSLNAAQDRARDGASKWWFFLYGLMESFVLADDTRADNDELVSREKLVQSLELFMNESSLAEYESRLELILTFHCHAQCFDDGPRKEELVAVLWNVHNYYEQFAGDANAKIAALKAPIEKKLRDFVKIARWNDLSYWAVKEAVEKTHRKLHKFVREFEMALKQSVSSCLTVKPESYDIERQRGAWDEKSHREYAIDPTDFTVAKSANVASENVPMPRCELVSRSGTLLTKAKRLCREIILMSSYPCARMKIETFVHEFMEHSARLRDLEVDRSLPKSKQKSQAKSILQRKKMALADYFKTLNRMGLSYRIGSLTWRNGKDKVIDFAVPPVDLSTVSRSAPMKRIDEQLLVQWAGCERYYYKSLVKLNALDAILRTTQANLGQQNTERCLGYSAYLMLLSHKQKTTIAELFDRFVSLRIQISGLSQMEEGSSGMPRQHDLQCSADELKELLIVLEAGFEQLELCLQCCPVGPRNVEDQILDKGDVFTLESNVLDVTNANQADRVWQDARTLVKDCSSCVKSTAKRYDSVFMFAKLLNSQRKESDKAIFFTSKHLSFLRESFATIANLEDRMEELARIFSRTDNVHPIIENVIFLRKKMADSVRAFQELENVSQSVIEEGLEESNDEICKYERSLENLISSILLVIQKKYKETVAETDDDKAETVKGVDAVSDENNDEEEEDEIEENQLREKLVESLEKDIESLTLGKISGMLDDLLRMMHDFNSPTVVHCSRLLGRSVPLLQQFVMFVQFYLNEQVAAFRVTCKLLYLQLNVFMDLATNGFCIPKDLDVEEGDADESQEAEGKGGMGLGEGEGQKDVSERIESEDQLEDARPANEEQQKPDDKDCKEEEKGIEMSEDFDSKLQDIEKDPNDEEQSDDDDDNEDLDKEMGETEEGAEQLDKEIWGDDKEESENENGEPEEEGEGQGEETGGKEMGARDENSKKDREKDEGTDAEEEEEEEEKERRKEINEIDEPETSEDHVDPYHGSNQPPPEPEPFELPDDMDLDDEDVKEDDGQEENPFDVDEAKESRPPKEQDGEEKMEDDEEKGKEADPIVDSSEDEDEDEDEEGDESRRDPDDEKRDEEAENDADDAKSTEEQARGEKDAGEEEKKDEDEETERECEERAAPSADDASRQTDAAEQVEDTKDGSKDKVANDARNEEERQQESTENDQEDSADKGTGQSRSDRQEAGHAGSSARDSVPVSEKKDARRDTEKRKSPGKSDENRSLLDKAQPERKKLKLMHTEEELADENENENEESSNTERGEAETCEHIKNAEEFDDYTVDAATEDQVKRQASNMDDEDEREKDEPVDVEMHQDEEVVGEEDENVAKRESEKVTRPEQPSKQREEPRRSGEKAEDGETEVGVVVEGEVARTSRVDRGNETTFHTRLDETRDGEPTSARHVERTRFEVERMLGEWNHVPTTDEAAAAWSRLCSLTEPAARDLSEKLRLVLEPTRAARLRGDYRTGRRINMRKIIPYIASQFRKDKIWMRRTRPSKRDYQIVLALDDSSSMADNHSKELAFESLSLIGNAMTYLEAGELGVLSFGERVSVMHPLGEPFTERSGSRLMQEMRFEQKKTMVGQLVDFTVDMFECKSGSADNAKLLVVLSDGRGIFSEGTDKVNQAVRRARLADIFLVFIVVDNPINKDSILDIRMPVFEGGKLLGIRSYMDNFPFPFYMILKDMNMLPDVLSDALRQWFEVVGKIDT